MLQTPCLSGLGAIYLKVMPINATYLVNERIKLFLRGNFNLVILDVKLDYDLTFNSHISNFVKKLAERVAPARVAPYMSISKGYILKNAFFKSQFNYCSLVWMCQSKE